MRIIVVMLGETRPSAAFMSASSIWVALLQRQRRVGRAVPSRTALWRSHRLIVEGVRPTYDWTRSRRMYRAHTYAATSASAALTKDAACNERVNASRAV